VSSGGASLVGMGEEGTTAPAQPEACPAVRVGAHVDALLEQGPDAVIVDLSEVERLSSSDVTWLLRIGRLCRARGIAVEVRCPSRRSWETLRRSGLHPLLRTDRPR
jgi:ABC-type transporter Mla MlaB component